MLIQKSLSTSLFKNKLFILSQAYFSKQFRSGDNMENLGSNFSFPKHKELFTDAFYEDEEFPTAFEQEVRGPFTEGKDYKDPNEPFDIENPYVPGGILSQYKKRLNLTEGDLQERDYMNNLKNFSKEAKDFFNTVSKNEKDLMNTTKNIKQRLRLGREIDFSEDFRKRFMTKEYGNYDKYLKNQIKMDVDKSVQDQGMDNLIKNYGKFTKRIQTVEKEDLDKREGTNFEDLISNESYANQTLQERYDKEKLVRENPEEAKDIDMTLEKQFEFQMNETEYFGRMSPFAKEELYQLYLKGTTVKDLSLKYGILPQRVKAIVFQKHLYWTEVYPKMGETHMRLALEREAIYAMDFPFVDYGIDIQIMSQMEAGVELRKVKRSEADARPPKELEEKIEKSLTKVKSRRSDMIPIGFIGKAGKGYVLKEYVRHRGLGSPMVNKDFKDAVRLMGTDREHHLSKFKKLRMQEGGPRLKAAWLLKCKALTKKAWIDDLEIDEEGVADILMDDNAMNNAPRPGTSFSRPLSSVGQPGGISQMVRPMSNAGRPISGYQRPGTNRPVSGMSRGNLSTALQGQRPGTSRPVTSGGRLLRLGTASMLQQGGQFIMADKLNAKNVAKKKHIAKAVVDYLIYVESNFRRALDIAAEATQMVNYNDWWWKARIGKCQFKMGMIKDSEKQFLSSLKTQDMITTHIEVAKVSIRLDQPLKAIEMFNQGLKSHPFETHLVIGIARIHDLLNDMPKSTSQYKNVLSYDNQNIEAIASLASYHFYTDQPEVALRFYRRLVQCGVHNSELWNNMGLCCFYASQYDMALSCFDKALSLSDDSNVADVWYNIGHVAIGIGDLGLAYQSFKIAVSNNPNHAESFNNLGVLELRKGNVEQSKSNFLQSARIANFLFEPSYNAALLSLKKGEFQESYTLVQQALQIFPDHADSKELLKNLNQHFSIM